MNDDNRGTSTPERGRRRAGIRALRHAAGSALVVLGVVAAPLPVRSETTESTGPVAASAADLSRLRAAVRALKAGLGAGLERQRTEEAALERIEVALGNTTRTLLGLEADRDALTEKNSVLARRAVDLAGAVGRRQRALGMLVRAAFTVERRSSVRLLLAQPSTASAGRALSYARYLHAHTAEQLASLGRAAGELERLHRALAERSGRLGRLIAQAHRTQRQLESQRDQRAKVLAGLNLGIQSKREALVRLNRDRDRLERLLVGLEDALDRQEATRTPTPVRSLSESDWVERESFSSRQGRLPWPANGTLAHGFGSPRAGENLTWRGIFLSGARDAAVRAVAPGQVAFADWLRGFGLLLIIDHADGYMSLYGHNSTLLKEAGDWVDTTQPIARIGDSGGLPKAGLYFEIRHLGQPIDPLGWLEQQGSPHQNVARGVAR